MTEPSANESKINRPQRRLPWHRKLLFTVLAVFFGLVFLEGMCGLIWMGVSYRNFVSEERITQRPADELQANETLEAYHCEYDEELGWVHIPGRSIADFYGPRRNMTINGDGFRGLVDYFGQKPAGKYRVVCLGDSMTMGYGVDDKETYAAQLEALNPQLQVVNMGMGDYSVTQCGIWYRRVHEQLDSDLLIFAFITSDIMRNVDENHPTCQIVDGRVEVSNRPVPRRFQTNEVMVDKSRRLSRFLVENSDIARTISSLNPRTEEEQAPPAEPMTLTHAMIVELAQLTKSSGKRIAIVLLPHASEVPFHYAYNLARRRIFWQISEMIAQTAQEQDVPYLNLLPAFASHSPQEIESFFLREIYAHYSPRGNELIAKELDAWLSRQFPEYADQRAAGE